MDNRTTRLGAALCLGALLAACGAAGDATPAARQIDTPTTTVASDEPPGNDDTGAPADTRCIDVEQRTLETAVEAYFAENDRFPSSPLELFEDGFLRVEYTGFEIDSDGTVVRAPDHPCTDVAVEPDLAVDEPLATTAPPTTAATSLGTDDFPMGVDEWLDILGDDVVEALGGPACASEVAAIVVAALEYGGIDSPDPESLEVLAPYLDRPIELWTLEPGDETPQPVPGSGCSTAGFDLDVDLPEPPLDPEPIIEDRCRGDLRTLTAAVDAFVLDRHTAEEPYEGPAPGEAELVDLGYLREPVELADLAGWEAVPVPGSPCEQVASCDVVLRTVETAVEAFYAENGSWPTSIDELVGTYLRIDAPTGLVELGEDGRVDPAPGSPCAGLEYDTGS